MATKEATLRALKRQRTMRLARLLSRAFYLRRRGRKSEMYNLICDEMVSLGGVYVKFLQGVLLNGKVMRQWTNPNRLKIFENLETEPIDIIGLLRHEIPAEQLKDITLVQPEPFAAGSFGQVYFGQHKNGKQIIIKILRPQVRELLRYDLKMLGIFAKRFTAGEYKNISVKLDQAIKEFRAVTLRETDYVSEANFARELFEAYKDHPKIVIPETYLELCTTHIIVQDYVGGVSGVDLLKIKERGEDPAAYIAERLGSDLDAQLITFGIENLRAVFNLPRIQGDPHPGNIRFLPDNKVGMIDFGIAATTPENKSAFFGIIDEWSRMYGEEDNIGNLFEQFMRFFVSDLYKALKKISSMRTNAAPTSHTEHSHEPVNFSRELGKLVQEILRASLGEQDIKALMEDGRMIQVFNNMVNKNNRFGLVVKIESSEILRASQTYMTMVDALGRRRTVIPVVFSSVAQIIKREHPEIQSEADEPMSTARAMETINTWLERVAMRDPVLFDKLIRRIKLNSQVPLQKTLEAPTETPNA